MEFLVGLLFFNEMERHVFCGFMLFVSLNSIKNSQIFVVCLKEQCDTYN